METTKTNSTQQHDLVFCQLGEASEFHNYRADPHAADVFYCTRCLQQVEYITLGKGWTVVRPDVTR